MFQLVVHKQSVLETWKESFVVLVSTESDYQHLTLELFSQNIRPGIHTGNPTLTYYDLLQI